MSAEPPSPDIQSTGRPADLPSLEDLLPSHLTERLRTISPGIAWALESFAVSFSAELEHLDEPAREAFARITLGYGERLNELLRLAQASSDPEQLQERRRKIAQLRQLDLFADLNEFDLGQIASAFQRVSYPQGDVLAEQGSDGDSVFFLEHGRVGIIVDGNQVAIRGEGTLFGETSVITDEPVNATLRAVSPCEVLTISREDFRQLVLGLPELVPKIARVGFTRLEEATHRLSEVLSHMPDALLKIDKDGMITGDVSSKCFQYLGSEVLTGRRFSEVLFKDSPTARTTWEQAFPEVWEHPDIFYESYFSIPRETPFQLGPENLRHYHINLFPCFRRGVQEGFDVAISDLTEQKQMEAERERMQRALERKRRKFMLFRLGDQRFGLEIEKVREIIEAPTITRVPNAPAFLRGFFNLRGHIISALDLRVLLELPREDKHGQGCIFIVELDHEGETVLAGLIADDVDDILDIYDTEITLAEELTAGVPGMDYLYGVARAEDGERLLLDPERVITPAHRKTLSALHSRDE